MQSNVDDELEAYSKADLQVCMKKVIGVDLEVKYAVKSDLHFTMYYSGHTFGATMVYIEYGSETLLYTGDFNTITNGFVGPARVPRLQPDVMISESTYCGHVRTSRMEQDTELLILIKSAIKRGGKILIPVTSLNLMELAVVLELYWKQSGLNVPIYFHSLAASKSNSVIKRHSSWLCSSARNLFVNKSSSLVFPHLQEWREEYIKSNDSCVLLAPPVIMNSGVSLNVFKYWASDARNMVIFTVSKVLIN